MPESPTRQQPAAEYSPLQRVTVYLSAPVCSQALERSATLGLDLSSYLASLIERDGSAAPENGSSGARA